MPRLIDADALRIYNVDLEHGCTVVDYALAVIKSVSEAPTIDAEPVRHGTWKLINTPSMFMRMLECSGCKGRVGTTVKTNYCPHCGAKMDGGENDEG